MLGHSLCAMHTAWPLNASCPSGFLTLIEHAMEVTLNVASAGRRGPPPLPTTRTLASTHRSAPVTKPSSGRQADASDPEQTPVTAIRSAFSAKSSEASVPLHRSAVQNRVSPTALPADRIASSSSTATTTLRDASLHTLMADIRRETLGIVAAAVERAVGPLLERQRQLEQAVAELRTLQTRETRVTSSALTPEPSGTIRTRPS